MTSLWWRAANVRMMMIKIKSKLVPIIALAWGLSGVSWAVIEKSSEDNGVEVVHKVPSIESYVVEFYTDVGHTGLWANVGYDQKHPTKFSHYGLVVIDSRGELINDESDLTYVLHKRDSIVSLTSFGPDLVVYVGPANKRNIKPKQN